MVDSAGHGHGPDSPQAHAALAEVDAAIGRLRAGLVERGLLDRTNLVIVSDHGMATVAPEHAVAIEDMVSRDEATVVAFGQSVGIAPNPGFEAAVEATLLGAHERTDCWRKAALTALSHYATPPPLPPISN